MYFGNAASSALACGMTVQPMLHHTNWVSCCMHNAACDRDQEKVTSEQLLFGEAILTVHDVG